MKPMEMTARIVGLGARSPLGLNALQIAMCQRAAQMDPRASRFRDKRGVTIGTCRCPGLGDDLYGFDRFVALGTPALQECASDLTSLAPMVLALPDETRPDQDKQFGERLVAALSARARVPVDIARSTFVRADNAGFAFALTTALEKLRTEASVVLVGGIDSYYHPDVLAALDEDCRLHTEWAEGGILPSEGAAFLRITAENAPVSQRGGTPREKALAHIAHVATGYEASFEDPDAPSLAKAMTDVLRALLARRAATPNPSTWLISDKNGERQRILEWSKVEPRLAEEFGEFCHDKPIEEMGTSGAATGALLATIACTLFRVGAAPSQEATITLAADGSARGGVLLRSAA